MTVMVNMTALGNTVAVGNGKGGVGKTSVAANIAGIVAAASQRTLLIDLNPQGNLGEDLGYTHTGTGDGGAELVAALLGKRPLQPSLTSVRPHLDVICGGEEVSSIEAGLMVHLHAGRDRVSMLAESLAPLAESYNFVVIDTPPESIPLQSIALAAARWLLIPTRADASSIKGLVGIAQRVANARLVNPDLDIAGVCLFDLPTSASAVRRAAAEQIEAVLGDVAPLFTNAIRHSASVAAEARNSGRLVHEIAAAADTSEPFWVALREGRKTSRLPGTAGAAAEDYVLLTQELLDRMAAAKVAAA